MASDRLQLVGRWLFAMRNFSLAFAVRLGVYIRRSQSYKSIVSGEFDIER